MILQLARVPSPRSASPYDLQGPAPIAPARRVPWPHLSPIAVLRLSVVMFAVLATVLAAVRAPQSDEGHFANAAELIAFEGRFAMPMWTAWISTLDQRVYSNMPLYFVGLAGWFKLFGVGLLTMRLFSVVWGVALVVAGFVILRALSRDTLVACLGVVVLALSYDVINIAAARYDIMAAALNMLGWAAYLHYRERNLGRAALLANACLAAACLTHPYGVFGMGVLAVFALALDRRRLALRHLAVAAAPYVLALGAWGIYIAHDVEMFRLQFAANSTGRVAGFRRPFAAIVSELHGRYLVGLGGWRADLPLIARVKLLALAFYAAGVGGCLLTPQIRRRPEYRALLLGTLAAFGMLTFLESLRWYVYLIYAVPLYALCSGVFLAHLMSRGATRRVFAGVAVLAFAALTIGTVATRVRIDAHRRAFTPVARYLRERMTGTQLVIAGGEFGLYLDFERHVHDDVTLGYALGRLPDYVVIGPQYRANLRSLKRSDSRAGEHVRRILTTYRKVYATSAGNVHYEVYAR
jgi:4-amino-4-deoxy-L-arabinose transferase-like glycosyltransferase